jgi:hypothetical protein
MAGTVWTTVQVAMFGSPLSLASRRQGDVTYSGSQGLEDRIEMRNHVYLAADHHAVASLKTPHTATRTNVDVVDLFLS